MAGLSQIGSEETSKYALSSDLLTPCTIICYLETLQGLKTDAASLGFSSCKLDCRLAERLHRERRFFLYTSVDIRLCGTQALASNNLEKVASTMEQFERQFENLDVQSQFVESAMNNQASLSTPEEDVNMLMQQVCPSSHISNLLRSSEPDPNLMRPTCSVMYSILIKIRT